MCIREFLCCVLSQSDLSDLVGSPRIQDFQCWTHLEVAILGFEQLRNAHKLLLSEICTLAKLTLVVSAANESAPSPP